MPTVPSPVAARVNFDARDMATDTVQHSGIRQLNEESQVENARGLSGYRCGRWWQNSPTALGGHAWLIELELRPLFTSHSLPTFHQTLRGFSSKHGEIAVVQDSRLCFSR